jgi:hypothetical protein
MEGPFLLALVGLTSLCAVLAGAKGLGLSPGALRHAAGRMLETIGLTLVFVLGNLAVGGTAILVARALTGAFVSLYLAADETLLALSLLQALIFREWREGSGV